MIREIKNRVVPLEGVAGPDRNTYTPFSHSYAFFPL